MGGILQAVQAVGAVASLFGGGGSAPAPAPVAEAPKPIPTADTAAIAAAKQKSMAAQRGRSGRLSTFLSEDQGQSTTLGG